jgi:anti-sigma-K factor RskA
MKCERIAELLPDYLQGNLNHEQDDQVETHLEGCTDCRAEVATWRELAMLPQEQPGPGGRMRFKAMLDAYLEGRGAQAAPVVAAERSSRGWGVTYWFGSRAAGVAAGVVAAVALLTIGYFGGAYVNRPKGPSPDLAAMQAELTKTQQMVVLSMLQQQSASERLQGVTFSTREQLADPRVLSALLHTLRYDNSVDVRLAALDALTKNGSQPQVRKGLMDALQGQQSPLVQVGLIDFLVESRDSTARQQLETLKLNPNLNPTVRQRAEWAISKLN